MGRSDHVARPPVGFDARILLVRLSNTPKALLLALLTSCGGGDGGQLGPVVQLGDNLSVSAQSPTGPS
jgi:hypothetical protein